MIRNLRSPSFLLMVLAGTLLLSVLGSHRAQADLAGNFTVIDHEDPFSAAAYSFRVFRDSDGIPQNTVHAITRDRRGFLWIGTQDGAAYFDGRKWTVVNMPNRLKSNFVRAILSTSDGSLWFATQAGGLFRLKDGAWTAAEELCTQTNCGRVNALVEGTSPSGRPVLWAGTHAGGLGRLEDGGWTIFSSRDGLPSNRIWALMEEQTAEGSVLWVGTQNGLAVLRPGADRFETEPGFPTESVNSLSLSRDQDTHQTFWVGTYGGGLATLHEGIWTRLTEDDGMPSNYLTSLVSVTPEDGPPITWAGTDGGGVVRIIGTTLETISTESGLPSDAVYSLLETRETDQRGMLWVGTRNGGLAQLVDGKWRRLSPTPGALAEPVNALLETVDEEGTSELWLGSDGGGLFRFTGGEWSTVPGGPPSDTIQCLARSTGPGSAKEVWVGTRNGGLGQLVAGRWRTFSQEQGALPSNMVQTLLPVGEGTSRSLWVGTRDGLSLLDATGWRRFSTEDGLPHNSVLSLLRTEDSDGESRFWAGTFNGLASFDGERWSPVIPSSGFLNNTVQSLHLHRSTDGRETLWIGTDGGGLAVLDLENDGEVLFLLNDTSTPALPNNVVSAIVEDRIGSIYCLTNGGVARLTQSGSSSTKPSDFEILTYAMKDGLPLNEGNRGASIVDRAGRVWVGTVGGAAVLDPRIDEPDRNHDPLILEVRSGKDPGRLLSPGIDLRFGERHIVFSYALLSFFHEDRTRFRSQLVGLEAVPSPWTNEVKSEYRSLSPGTYTFRLWGRDAGGNVSGPIDFRFTILPPVWQTWWVNALLVLGALLGIYLILRIRIHSVRESERRLAQLVDARTRRLTEANQLLVELSYADPLTGVGNRRRFDELFAAEWRRAVRTQQPLSLLLFDVDLLKVYNDNFGHAMGDDCLKSVAAAVADNLSRAGDTIARFGGDEFAVILPGTESKGAVKVAENLRHAVSAVKMKRSTGSTEPYVTITCGVGTVIPTEMDDPQDLINSTDRSLYLAKAEGRNRVGAAIIPSKRRPKPDGD